MLSKLVCWKKMMGMCIMAHALKRDGPTFAHWIASLFHLVCHPQMVPLAPDCHGAELVQDSGGWIGRQQRGMLRAFGPWHNECNSANENGWVKIHTSKNPQAQSKLFLFTLLSVFFGICIMYVQCDVFCFGLSRRVLKLQKLPEWGLAASYSAGKTTQVQAVGNQLLTMDMSAIWSQHPC